MNWPELLLGAAMGAVAQSLVEVLIPGPSVLLSLLKRVISSPDKRYLADDDED